MFDHGGIMKEYETGLRLILRLCTRGIREKREISQSLNRLTFYETKAHVTVLYDLF